jgi:hypothetical protein
LIEQSSQLKIIKDSIEGIEDIEVKTKVIASLSRIKESTDNSSKLLNTISNSIKDKESSTSTKVSDSIIAQLENLPERFKNVESYNNEASSEIKKLTEYLEGLKTKTKFIDDNSNNLIDIIKNIIDHFNNYLATLSTQELCILLNILSCIFIILCVLSLILIYTGNFLIYYLDLENRLPRLAKFIRFRIKFQYYYSIFNIILIILTLILMLFTNIATLYFM